MDICKQEVIMKESGTSHISNPWNSDDKSETEATILDDEANSRHI
jgi:hypothetical protein